MVVAICVGLSPAALAAPDWEVVDLRHQLTALSRDLRSNESLRETNVADLVSALELPELSGLSLPRQKEPTAASPATFKWTDKRHALAALAQVYGGTNNRRVIEAGRPGDTEAILISSGVATLEQLRARLTARHLGRDIETGADILRVPLVVGEGAVLQLTDNDKVLLSRDVGAFIVNFGRLEMVGGEISTTEHSGPEEPEFSPFVTTVGSGSVYIHGATFKHLGFGFTAKFSGFSILSHPTMLARERNFIENSRFDNLVTVAVVGAHYFEARGNRFFDMRRNPILLSHAPDAVVEGNLFSGDSPTNAIRVANGSTNAIVSRNIILEGARAGLLISSQSHNAKVLDNVIWRRNGGGIKLYKVRCGEVAGNLVLDDKQKGVEVRDSADVMVRQNRIIGNANAGVWVSANPPENITYVVGNLLRENGSGLSTANAGNIALQGNDLSNQFPRFLDGDVTHHFRAIVSDMHGRRPIVLDAAEIRPTSRLTPDTCTF